jgi:hypothetical protein
VRLQAAADGAELVFGTAHGQNRSLSTAPILTRLAWGADVEGSQVAPAALVPCRMRTHVSDIGRRRRPASAIPGPRQPKPLIASDQHRGQTLRYPRRQAMWIGGLKNVRTRSRKRGLSPFSLVLPIDVQNCHRSVTSANRRRFRPLEISSTKKKQFHTGTSFA